MKKVSVIIVSYNVCHFLEHTLRSVRKAASFTDTEIIVVDNCSKDGSAEMVKSKFPEVTLIASKKNLGFSRANNFGIKQAKGEYILLLNPDTFIQENALISCAEFMDNHPNAGALGVKMIDGSGNYLPESKRGFPTPWVAFYKIFGLADLFPKSKKFGKYHLKYLDKNEVHKIEVLSGAYMFIRKSALESAGLLDEDFFMYGEDIDLSYRIVKAGYDNYYFPGTTIIHYKGESTKKTSVNYVFVFYNAMIVFAHKHLTARKAGVFAFLIKLAIYLRAAISLISKMGYKIWSPVNKACTLKSGKLRIVIAAEKEEKDHIINILKCTQKPWEYAGWISNHENDSPDPMYLGTLNNMNKIMNKLSPVHEIIFSTCSFHHHEIIDYMANHPSKKIKYKMVPEECDFMLGSNSTKQDDLHVEPVKPEKTIKEKQQNIS